MNQDILRPFHATFDFWEDSARKNRYLGLMAVEANYETQELDNYVVEMAEWEDCANDDLTSLVIFVYIQSCHNCR